MLLRISSEWHTTARRARRKHITALHPKLRLCSLFSPLSRSLSLPSFRPSAHRFPAHRLVDFSAYRSPIFSRNFSIQFSGGMRTNGHTIIVHTFFVKIRSIQIDSSCFVVRFEAGGGIHTFAHTHDFVDLFALSCAGGQNLSSVGDN